MVEGSKPLDGRLVALVTSWVLESLGDANQVAVTLRRG